MASRDEPTMNWYGTTLFSHCCFRNVKKSAQNRLALSYESWLLPDVSVPNTKPSYSSISRATRRPADAEMALS